MFVSIRTPKFRHNVTFCGADVGDSTCHRLPMHSGDHRTFVRGNGVPQPKAPKAVKVVTRVVTIAGTKYRVPLGKDAQPRFAKAEAIVTSEPEPKPTASPRKPAAQPKAVKPRASRSAKPRVRVIPMAKSRRRVASSTGR